MTREEAINEIKSWAIPSKNGREVLETLIPELAESDDEESDDERIRKYLIEELKAAKSVGELKFIIPQPTREECIAYLEKQKESLHIPETCKENANSFADGIIEVRSFQRGMEEGRKLEKQKEQKQAQTSEEKEYIRTIKSIISDFIRDKKPEDLAYYQRIYDWLDGRHVPFSCGHENGQPADPVFSKQEYESHPIISEDTTSVKPVEFDGKTLLYTADKSYQIGFRDGVASVKPAEWSEEDKKVLDDAYCWLCEYAGSLIQKNHEKSSMLYEIANKLNSLRPSIKEQVEEPEYYQHFDPDC